MRTVSKLSTDKRPRSKGPFRLHLIRARADLIPHPEPYWGDPVARGQYVGLRKIDAERASWIARKRFQGSDGKYHTRYESLGWLTPKFDLEQAKVKALEFFNRPDAEESDYSDVVTVADACRAYVAEKTAAKEYTTAHDAHKAFERTVYGSEKYAENGIAKVQLVKLSAPRLKAWRDGLSLSLVTSNRTLTRLKAALNLAVANNPNALAAIGLQWSVVVPHKIKTDSRRKLVLDLHQRRALLNAAKGPIRDLIEATSLTGARAGELTSAKVEQFNARTKELSVTGKTGTRDIKLSGAAVTLFKRLAKGKASNAYLLTRENGTPWAHSDWDHLVKEAAKTANLPDKTCLYTLRHSWISQMISAGMTTLDVARLCGTSLVMIEKHYGKPSKDIKQRLDRVEML